MRTGGRRCAHKHRCGQVRNVRGHPPKMTGCARSVRERAKRTMRTQQVLSALWDPLSRVAAALRPRCAPPSAAMVAYNENGTIV